MKYLLTTTVLCGALATSSYAVAQPVSVYVTNFMSNSVSAIDTGTGAIEPVGGTFSNPNSVAASLDGGTLYVTNYGSGRLSIVDASLRQEVSSIYIGAGLGGAVLSTDGGTLYFGTQYPTRIFAMNTATLAVTQVYSQAAYFQDLTISRDGHRLYIATAVPSGLTILDLLTQTTQTLPYEIWSVRESPDGTVAFGVIYSENRVVRWDVATLALTTLAPLTSPVQLGVAEDGTKLYVTSDAPAALNILDVGQPTTSASVPLPAGSRPFLLRLSPGGRLVYVSLQTGGAVARVDLVSQTYDLFATGDYPEGLAIVPRHYTFDGFFRPVDSGALNLVAAGRSVPLKFSLGMDYGLAILDAGSPRSQQITCDTGAPVTAVVDTVAAGSSGLSYDAMSAQYLYVWKTDSTWTNTCRLLTVRLNDGSSHSVAFKFK